MKWIKPYKVKRIAQQEAVGSPIRFFTNLKLPSISVQKLFPVNFGCRHEPLLLRTVWKMDSMPVFLIILVKKFINRKAAVTTQASDQFAAIFETAITNRKFGMFAV